MRAPYGPLMSSMQAKLQRLDKESVRLLAPFLRKFNRRLPREVSLNRSKTYRRRIKS